jgi:hypothetical protein
MCVCVTARVKNKASQDFLQCTRILLSEAVVGAGILSLSFFGCFVSSYVLVGKLLQWVSSITDNLLNELVFLSVFSTHPLFINKSRRSAYLDERKNLSELFFFFAQN